jgi:hypothetical protein
MEIHIDNFLLIFENVFLDKDNNNVIYKKTKLKYSDFLVFLNMSINKNFVLSNNYEESLDIIIQNIDYINFTNNPLIRKSTSIILASIFLNNRSIIDDNYVKTKLESIKIKDKFFNYLDLVFNYLIIIKNKSKKNRSLLKYNLIDIIYYNCYN